MAKVVVPICLAVFETGVRGSECRVREHRYAWPTRQVVNNYDRPYLDIPIRGGFGTGVLQPHTVWMVRQDCLVASGAYPKNCILNAAKLILVVFTPDM